MTEILSAAQTGRVLPYPGLFDALESVLLSPSVNVPARNIHNTVGASRFFVMPAFDKEVCITKLISHVPENPAQGLPAIVGQVVVFDAKTGLCRLVLDGPTVTARRTAAVTGLFLRKTNRVAFDQCLIVGAGVQGRSHLEMLREIAPPRKVTIVSRKPKSSQALARHAESLGFTAQALPEVPNIESFDLIITCTPAKEAVMHSRPQSNAILCAIGSYTPKMLEWHPDIVRWIASTGQVFVDSRDADHEAGDLLQAELSPSDYPCLGDLISKRVRIDRDKNGGPILFKSCGWGGWDLAAAKCALRLWSPEHDR